jgi:GNAT superfamily N-acetyltransferase
METTITVKKATLEDYHTVLELLYVTAGWLKSKGLKQWADLPTGARDHKIEATILSGETFLFYKGEQLAGTITLQTSPGEWDLDLWKGVREDLESSIFVHRIATHRDFAGQGLGQWMLDWAFPFGEEAGKIWVRLDCVGDNPPLNAFYQRCGFIYLGQSENGFSLYEKRIQPVNLLKKRPTLL